jgi:hypothetical protein
MRFKWHWGVGIAAVYIGFVIIRIITIVISEHNDVELVAPDYYDREIKYEDRIQAKNNAKSLTEAVILKKENRNITIIFPEQFKQDETKGQIILFRPSDKRMDKIINFQLDSKRRQLISLEGLKNGYWKVQLNWSDGQKKYFEEFPIVLHD